MIVLQTDRLQLRHLEPTDLDDLMALYSDEEVMRYVGGTRSRERAQAGLGLFRHIQEEHGYSLWATTLKVDRRFVGRCGLLPHEFDGVVEPGLVYMIARPYWGRGYATEAARGIVDYAARSLGMRRLVALAHEENAASRRVAEKLGMIYERTIEDEHGPMRLYSLSLTNPSAA